VLHTMGVLKVASHKHNLDETVRSYVTLKSFVKFVADNTSSCD